MSLQWAINQQKSGPAALDKRPLTSRVRAGSAITVRSFFDNDTNNVKDSVTLGNEHGDAKVRDDVTKTKFGEAYASDGVKKDELDDQLDATVSLSDLPWGGRWLDFVGDVSIGGLKYAVSPTGSTTRRSVWTFLVVLGFGFMLYQIYERYVYNLQSHALPDLRKVRLQLLASCSI